MIVIVRPRQGGKTTEVLRVAALHFAYIVVPTRADVDRLWQQARLDDINIPQPITWQEFIEHRYHGTGVRAFVIDDLDRCVQSMTGVEVKAASLTS